MKQENIELKAQLEKLSEQQKEEVVEEKTELEEVKPIAFNPENKSENAGFRYGQNGGGSILDRVMSKINS